MARLPCDKCRGQTNTWGSWDAPWEIICSKCQDKEDKERESYIDFDTEKAP